MLRSRRTTLIGTVALLAGCSNGTLDNGVGDADAGVDAGSDAPVLDTDSLRAKVTAELPLIGAAAALEPLLTEPSYAEALGREFNSITAENAMKWEELQPDPGVFDFADADALVDFAGKNDQSVRGHVLLWHRQLPSWVGELDAAALSAAVQDHIQTVVGHYKGRLAHWDVVNEAIGDDALPRNSVFFERLGIDYVGDAFVAARAADPDAILFYNDYGIEGLGAKSDAVFELISGLLERDVPIDALGIQGHLTAYEVMIGALDETSIRANIARFAALGLRIYFTEIDVRVSDLALTAEEVGTAQRETYRLLTNICRTEPSCDGVIAWGVTDKYSWVDDEFGPDDPLLFDESYQRKPSYFGVVDGLAGADGLGFPTLQTSCGEAIANAQLCEPFESSKTGSLFAVVSQGATVAGDALAYKGNLSLKATSPGNGAAAFGVRQVLADTAAGTINVRAYVQVPSGVVIDGLALFGVGSAIGPQFPGITVNLTNQNRVQLSNTIASDFRDSGPNYVFPRDQWNCVVLSIDVGDAADSSIAVDGTLRVSAAGLDTLPDGGYQNTLAGIIFSSPAQGAATVLLDELAVSTQPLACD